MALRRITLAMMTCALALLLPGGNVSAQGIAGMEPKILDLTRSSWAYFRDFNGRQLVYFTHLEVYRCGIEAVHYSLDSDALDREWKLQPCDPDKPNEITTDTPYVSLPPRTAETVSVRLTFKGGTKSAIVRIDRRNKLVH